MYKDSFRHRKKFYITLFTSIYVIIFTICALVIAANWKYVKQLFNMNQQNISTEQQQFNETIYKIKRLEELSKEYDSNDYQLRAVVYIRASQYNDSYWNLLGLDDENFVQYVENHQGDVNVSSLRALGIGSKLRIPKTKQNVDFYHLFATLNGLMLEIPAVGDLTGWAGDLCQLASIYNETILTGDNLLSDIRNQMNFSSVFGMEDFYADCDAVNIYNLMNKSALCSDSLYLSTAVYYASLSKEDQITNFKQNTFTELYSSPEELEDVIYSRLQNNYFIQQLCDSLSFDFPDVGENEDDSFNATIYKACIKVFVEKLKT